MNDCNLTDVKCNNKLINYAIKQKIYHDYNRALFKTLPNVDNKSILINAHSEFKEWPIAPKVKETHFTIINRIYPTAEFLKKRFRSEVDPCIFWNSADETLEHLFFSCSISQQFGLNIKNWLSLKLNMPSLNITHILFYMDNWSPPISNIINIVLLSAKHHIHCSKWKGNQPSFPRFITEFKLYYSALLRLKEWRSAGIISHQISESLLF